MTTYEYVSIIVALLGMLLIPVLTLLYRAVVKWTKTESRLTQIAENQNRIYVELVEQMKEDRAATNERLTWLEHNLWAKK